MDRESIDKLRFDKRLSQRPGWVSPEDLEKEIASLADASEKIQPPETDEGGAGGDASAAQGEASTDVRAEEPRS